MKYTIDTDTSSLVVDQPSGRRRLDLFGAEAFELLSRVWIDVGWELKYSYRFTWMGRPIIQLPEDIIRIQEVIYRARPDVVIETGVAHGGSLIFYAALLRAMGCGRVIGIDIRIRPENREAIEAHELAPSIQLIEGSSVSPEIVSRVREHVREDGKVLVILDSAHDRAHVRAELEAYARFVTVGSYIVATDGVMQQLTEVPRGRPEWSTDNPAQAARDFAAEHDEFVIEEPPRPFDEAQVHCAVTYWPDAYLRRIR